MKMTRLICVAVSLAAFAGCTQEPHQLRLVTPASFIDRGIVADLGKLFDDDSLVQVELTAAAGNE